LDTEAISRPLWKIGNAIRGGAGKGWTTVRAIKIPSYYYFEYLFWKKFSGDLKRGEYDLVHRITPLSPTVPSLVANKLKRSKVPFVVGPLNGGVPWPREFRNVQHQEREWLSYIRDAYKLLPGYSAMMKSGSAVIAGSRYTLNQLPENHKDKYFYIPENAVDPKKFPSSTSSRFLGKSVLRACFIGRLVPYKGPAMMLEACAGLIKKNKLTVDVVGDGPMNHELRSMAGRLGIENGVTFHGWVAHEDINALLNQCQLLVFPSIREFGGGVVLESMALGIVPLVIDYAGPGELVTEKTGFKVPMGEHRDIVRAIDKQLERIATSQDDLPDISRAGIDRVMNLYTWERKAQQIMEVYSWVIDPATPRPDFPFD
jgi:glycosyltransferase involved in cell wall biosynthesis